MFGGKSWVPVKVSCSCYMLQTDKCYNISMWNIIQNIIIIFMTYSTTESTRGTGTAYHSGAYSPVLEGLTQFLSSGLATLLIFLSSFLFWLLYYLSFDLRILITPFGIFKLFIKLILLYMTAFIHSNLLKIHQHFVAISFQYSITFRYR